MGGIPAADRGARVRWSDDWTYEMAAQALKYLAENYPESGGSEALDSYHHAVNEAAVREDRDAYEGALREYMRVARRVALAIRRGAA